MKGPLSSRDIPNTSNRRKETKPYHLLKDFIRLGRVDFPIQPTFVMFSLIPHFGIGLDLCRCFQDCGFRPARLRILSILNPSTGFGKQPGQLRIRCGFCCYLRSMNHLNSKWLISTLNSLSPLSRDLPLHCQENRHMQSCRFQGME